MVGNIFCSCGTKATPSAETSRGGRPPMARSPSRTLPRRGARMPATTLSSVDFPAPLGPMMLTISPFATERFTPLSTSSAAE